MNAPAPREPELIAGGLPRCPEHILMDMGAGDYPLVHAEKVAVMSAPEFAAVVIGISRSDFAHGFFMGMSPDQARSTAAWLRTSADEIDGVRREATSDIAAQCRAWVLSPDYVDLTARQMALLSILCDEPGPHHVRHLAKAIGVQKPVISRSVDRFVALGLAIRWENAGDKRDRFIEATELGRKIRAALAGGGQ